MEELCNYIKANAQCGLGQTAPNPVLATLKFFKDEYIAHIQNKKYPAKCIKCSACMDNCKFKAISKQ